MSNLANAIIATAVLIALLCFFYGPWQRAAEDLTRQFIFERRSRLLMLACEGRVSFDSEAYKNARLMMNAFIRFAHDLSWPRLAFYAWDISEEPTFGVQLKESIAHVEDLDTRKAIYHILNEATAALVFMMAMKSIIFAIPTTILLVIGFCTKVFNQRVTERIENIERDDKSVVQKLSHNIQAQAAQQYGLAA